MCCLRHFDRPLRPDIRVIITAHIHTQDADVVMMAGVPEDEIKVDITLGHVGRHCILHALTVIEAAISQVCSSVCV